MGIGINLKNALNEHNMTVAELSRKTGISTNTLYAMIRRDNKKIDPIVLRKICENSEITVFDLLDDYEDYMVEYWDPETPLAERIIGDYILTQIGNEDMLAEIEEIYKELNDTGKSVAWERMKELKEIKKYTEPEY